MSRSTGVAAGIAGLLMGLAAQAVRAQEERPVTTQKDGGALRVTASGNVNLDYINRSREITAFTSSVSNINGLGVPATSDSENTFEGEVFLRLDVEFDSKINVVFEIGTKRADENPDGVGGGGINRLGDGGNRSDVLLREARIEFLEFVIPRLRVEAGLTTWTFDIRGQGSSFAFDPRHAQTLERQLGSDGNLNTRDDALARLVEAAFVEDMEAVGATVSYSFDPARIDVVFLPTMREEGGFSQDESMYAIDLMIPVDSLGKGSRFGIIVAVVTLPTDTFDAATGNPIGGANEHSQVYTVGGGTSLRLMEGLEVYGEVYVNFGKAGELNNGTSVKAKGAAFQGGFEWHYTVGNPLPFWLGVNYFYLSGEDSTDPGSDKNGKFASYENVNDLMILEDRLYGFDIDTNFTGVKISGGATFSAARENDLDVRLILGVTRTAEKVDGATGTTNKMGNEIDVRAKWSLNKQFQLRLSLAYLFGSEVLEEGMLAGGAPTSRAEDQAWLWLLGFDLTF